MKPVVTLLSLASILAHAQALEVATVKAFQGTEGQSVVLALLKPVKQGQALLRIQGTGSPFDGLVLAGQFEERSGRFSTRFHGGPWNALQVADGSGRAWFPEVKDFGVKFSDELTARVTAAELLAEHQRQLAAGDLAMFAKKEHPHLTKKYEGKAAAAMAGLGKACPRTFAFVWSSFSDDEMDNLDIWALCEPLVVAVRQKCEAAKGSARLVCRMGPKLELARGGDAITFTTTPKGNTLGLSFVAAALGN
ncbi:MAG: hypothetical protein H6Q89_5536 [Myxococcaceae bacterium]|nr:hypothetical protein [Myxococcaceae bacterium]